MSAKKSADQWFADYGASHRHRTNELIHWLCVPLIFFSVLGFCWSLPAPEYLQEHAPGFNWALVAILAATLFYVRLSPRLSAGLLFFMSLCYTTLVSLELSAPYPVWQICAVLFVVAWLGQFIGHKIEGQQPAFLQDLVFLLVGPAWLMSRLYQKLGQRY